MSSATASGGRSARGLPLVLGIIGVIAIVIGVVYMTVTGLPHFMVAGSHVHAGSGHHLTRGGVAIGIGVLLLIGAWITGKPRSR